MDGPEHRREGVLVQTTNAHAYHRWGAGPRVGAERFSLDFLIFLQFPQQSPARACRGIRAVLGVNCAVGKQTCDAVGTGTELTPERHAAGRASALTHKCSLGTVL